MSGGLATQADHTTFRGLSITGFTGLHSAALFLDNSNDSTVVCNSLTGNTKGVAIGGNNSIIGGSAPGTGNFISGNIGAEGIVMGTTNNVIQGNFIGTNIAGTAASGNFKGIALEGSSADNTIGGTAPGARNLISGNSNAGIAIKNNSANNLIEGNYVGVDITGLSGVGNGNGIVTDSTTSATTIGGTDPGARNIISGNTGNGILTKSTGDSIQGNYVGTDTNGTGVIGNGGDGIQDQGSNNTIGGTAPGAGNVIAGSANITSAGINLSGTGGATVQGNYIGTNAAGTTALGNYFGVAVFAANNTIGGTTAAARNIISGNAYGIVVADTGASVTNNTIEGNYIGVAANGTMALGNTSDGIELMSSSTTNNTIGGTTAAAANIVAHNGGNGISTIDVISPLLSAPNCTLGAVGTGNAFLGNAIYGNGGLGIDLAPCSGSPITGLTANDTLDPDTGPNNLQNFPVITAATTNGTGTTVTGTLNSLASTTYRLEFFASAAADPSGNGEGQTYLGSTRVTTDGSGNASFTATGLTASTVGYAIAATASQDLGTGHFSTSEFSTDVIATAPPSPPAAPAPTGGGAAAPGWNIQIGATPSTIPSPAITPPPPASPPTSTPAAPTLPQIVSRNLNAERAAITTFIRLFGRRPASASDWLAVNHLAYGHRIARNPAAERRGLQAFTKRFPHLPTSDTDWRIVHVLGFVTAPLR